MSELTNAQREAAALKLQVPEVKAKLERCDKKNRTLRSIGGGVDTTLVEARMEEFEDRLERFESQLRMALIRRQYPK